MKLPIRIALSGAVVLVLAASYLALSSWGVEGRPLAFALLMGSAFGVVLQRSRFCFYCNLRDLIERREADGVLAILIALAAGAVGYSVIFGTWLPTPALDRLPPTAHVGPVSIVLVAASVVFGVGMAVSGSCLSAHFYRLGEGSPIAPFAIVGAALGFGLGFLTWNPLFELATSDAVIVWFPHWLGYGGSLAVTLGALAALAAIVLAIARPAPRPAQPAPGVNVVLGSIFTDRWPPVVAGLLVGVIATLYYFRIAPLGVTAELGSLVRTAGAIYDLWPSTLHGLDTLRGCAAVIKAALLSNNGVFVLGLIAGSFASALLANQFAPRLPEARDVARGLGGGVLLGWGAMTALGCTVGVLLSGIHAGSLSGWVFLAFCGLGAGLGILSIRRLGWR